MEFYYRIKFDKNIFDTINLNSRRVTITGKTERMKKKIDIIISDIIDKIPNVINKVSDQKRYTWIVKVENIGKTESEKENAFWNNTRIESVIIV